MSSPTQRTLALCRELGLLACIVEKWVAQARRRMDVFGFGDLLVLDGRPGSVLLQVTSSSNVSARVEKITTECAACAAAWLSSGNRIVVVGWGKRGPRGQRKVWTPRFVEVVLDGVDFRSEEREVLARGG